MKDKFKYISDIHGNTNFVNSIEEDKECTLILAGDIHEVKKYAIYKSYIFELCKKFKNVVAICGNHEYYTRSIFQVHNDIKKIKNELLQEGIDNFHFLNDSSVKIGNVYVLGGTMWTDFNKNNPHDKIQALMSMQDYKYIRHGPEYIPYERKLNTNDVEFLHHKTKKFIASEITNIRSSDKEAKIVVVTHHSPSTGSITENYKDSSLNYAFCSDMNDFIELHNPNVWVHGHIHEKLDYQVGECKILCNPLGYSFESLEPEIKFFEI